MTNLESVMQLYTAYFNRVADQAGVDYWLNEMNNNGWSIDDVANTFAQQTEYSDLYSGLNNSQIVGKVYQNVLNRVADAAGVEYWSGELNNGNISVTQLVQAVVTSATEKDASGNYVNNTDATIFNNKIEVSNYAHDINLNLTGEESVLLNNITVNSNSISDVKTQITESIFLGNTYYLLIPDEFDDNENNSTNDNVVVSMIYQDDNRLKYSFDDGSVVGNTRILINEGTLKEIESDGYTIQRTINSLSETKIMVNTTNDDPDYFINKKDAYIQDLILDKEYTQAYLDAVGTTYTLYKNDNNMWIVDSLKMENGIVYSANNFTENPTQSGITYSITSDGKILENDSGDKWYDVIVDVNENYIVGYTEDMNGTITDYNTGDYFIYTFFDMQEAQNALSELQSTGSFSDNIFV